MRPLRTIEVAGRLRDDATVKWFARACIDPWSGGAWLLPSCTDRGELTVLATITDGWDHVSVSRKTRCPNWAEMEQVKHLFFWPHETAMQLHVPPADHVNLHPFCLHLWRPQMQEIPRPPNWMVA
jgi:hypothetical protein